MMAPQKIGKQRSIIPEENFEEHTQEHSEKSVTVNYGGVEYMQGLKPQQHRFSNEESSFNLEGTDLNPHRNSFFSNFKNALGGITLNENYIDEAISSKSNKTSNNISS